MVDFGKLVRSNPLVGGADVLINGPDEHTSYTKDVLQHGLDEQEDPAGFQDTDVGGARADGFQSSTSTYSASDSGGGSFAMLTSEKEVTGYLRDHYEEIDTDEDGYLSDEELEPVKNQFLEADNTEGAYVIETLAGGNFKNSEQTRPSWDRADGEQSFVDDIQGDNDDKISGNDLDRISSDLEEGKTLDEISDEIDESSYDLEDAADDAGDYEGGKSGKSK